MRKGFLCSFNEGALSVLHRIVDKAEEITREDGYDVEGLFYATAFQAGIDHFVLSHRLKTEPQWPISEFLQKRTSIDNVDISGKNWAKIRKAFSNYLPENWWQDSKYSEVWAWNAFISDLLYAMETNVCVLSVTGVPDTVTLEDLVPPELFSPLKNLAAALESISAPTTVPTLYLYRENMERYQHIISGDLFANYVESETKLDVNTSQVPAILDDVLARGRELVRENPRLLSLRRSIVDLLSITPKVVDTLFGKLPGTIADIATKLGGQFIEERRRIVVYDFQSIMFHGTMSNLVRMLKAVQKNDSKTDKKS
jgi:hypothetical protein